MTLHECLDEVLSSELFRSWIALHSKAFLAHAFLMDSQAWQLGWYDAEQNKITTFIVDKELKKIEDQEFLATGKPIQALEIDKIKINHEQAMKNAFELLKKEYQNQIVLKTFLLLQLLGELPVYTITFFTKTLNTIIVKISAGDGKVLSHSKSSFTDFSRVAT